MNRLPSELHEKIFWPLPQKTRYQCALVCRQWLPAAERSLYATVRLHLQPKFDNFMNTLKMNPYHAYQVIEFRLSLAPLVGFDKRILCSLFPNIKYVEFEDPQYSAPFKAFKHGSIQKHPLVPTVEQIREFGDYNFTYYLIKSDLCSRLQVLDLHYTKKNTIIPCPISQLQNMPILKKLKMFFREFAMEINDFEKLHRNVPSIEVFEFRGTKLLPVKALPKITPNSCIKKIVWKFSLIADSKGDMSVTHIQWLQYIQKKYSNMESLNFQSYSHLPYDQAKNVVCNGWLPLIHTIGPQLKCLGDIDMVPDVDIFKALDDCGCKLEKLEIYSGWCILKLDDFIQSNQRHYLKELYIENVQPVIDVSLKDSKLEALTIYYSDEEDEDYEDYEKPVLLNDLFRLLPNSLKKLEIMNALVEYDMDDDVQSSITSFEVNRNGLGYTYGDLKKDIFKFCPKLEYIFVSDL